MRKLLLFALLFVLCAFSTIAQQDSTIVTYDSASLEVKQIDTEDIQKYQEDEAFNYEIIKGDLTWWDNFKTWLGNLLLRMFEGVFGVEKAVGFLSGFLRVVPYLLLSLLIYLLIKFLLNVNASSLQQAQKNKNLVSLSEEENIIRNEDIQELIDKALADKNYRLAIRYYYLYMLKLMSEKELITWELQKTNDDYLQEIKKTTLKTPFTKITYLYDYIWYGDFPIDEDGYNTAKKTFLQFQQMVKANA